MNELNQTNEPKTFLEPTYGDEKANKVSELNDSMSIKDNGKDEYEQKLHNLGGKE